MRAEVLAESLRERRRSLLWWGLGILALVALTVAFYPSIRDDTSLSDYAKDLPESVRALFTGGEVDITSPAGYLNSQIYSLMAPLILLVFSIGAGAGAIAGEEERGKLELVLAHPVTRRSYAVERFLSLAALVLVLSLILLVTTALGSSLVDLDIGFGKLLAASGSLALLAIFFGAFALAVGAVAPGRGRAIAVAGSLAAGSWVFDGLAQAVDALEGLRFLSPYNQALGDNPLREGVPWGGWLFLAVGTAIVATVAAVGLERRDLRQ